MFEKKIFSQTHQNKAGNGFENSKGAYNRVFNNGYSKHFGDGDKVEENDNKNMFGKKFFLKLIRIKEHV